jgi:hypothetical protein
MTADKKIRAFKKQNDQRFVGPVRPETHPQLHPELPLLRVGEEHRTVHLNRVHSGPCFASRRQLRGLRRLRRATGQGGYPVQRQAGPGNTLRERSDATTRTIRRNAQDAVKHTRRQGANTEKLAPKQAKRPKTTLQRTKPRTIQ